MIAASESGYASCEVSLSREGLISPLNFILSALQDGACSFSGSSRVWGAKLSEHLCMGCPVILGPGAPVLCLYASVVGGHGAASPAKTVPAVLSDGRYWLICPITISTCIMQHVGFRLSLMAF